MKKICKICNKQKLLEEFYKHKYYSDGRDIKCKECVKEKARERHHKKNKDTEWVEKERARHREKYARLNYKDKQKFWDEGKVWKNTSTYKNLHRNLKIPKGISAHHWNYFKLKDFVLMDLKDHKSFHQLIELDIDKRIFKIKETGEYLDSRNKHLCFIKTSGFGFSEYNKDVCYQLYKNQKI